MKNYKFTTRGKGVIGAIGLLAVLSLFNGGIYFASFVFAFCALGLCLSIYEFFFNQ